MKHLITLLSFVLLFFFSCKTSSEPETKELINTVWHLTAIEVTSDKIIKPPLAQAYTIQFKPDNTLLGYNACNEIHGEYALSSNSIIGISRLGTTYLGCGDGTIHDEYYGALCDLKYYEAKFEIKYNVLHIPA